MKNTIDRMQLAKITKDLPASPRDSRITTMGVVSLCLYLIGAYCAWKMGSWWGVGLVSVLFIISTLDELVHDEHRKELLQLHGLLLKKIAENSDILSDTIPTKKANISNNDFPS